MLLEQVCEFMQVPPTAISLEICEEARMPGAVGHYVRGERPRIRVASSQLADPEGSADGMLGRRNRRGVPLRVNGAVTGRCPVSPFLRAAASSSRAAYL